MGVRDCRELAVQPMDVADYMDDIGTRLLGALDPFQIPAGNGRRSRLILQYWNRPFRPFQNQVFVEDASLPFHQRATLRDFAKGADTATQIVLCQCLAGKPSSTKTVLAT